MKYLKKFNESINEVEIEQEINMMLIDLIDGDFQFELVPYFTDASHNAYTALQITIHNTQKTQFVIYNMVDRIKTLSDYLSYLLADKEHTILYSVLERMKDNTYLSRSHTVSSIDEIDSEKLIKSLTIRIQFRYSVKTK